MTQKLLEDFGLGSGRVLSSIKGGNSTVYCVEVQPDKLVAIKKYEGKPERIFRMYDRESKSIQFLNKKGIDFVPKFISGSEDMNAICYEWIDGVNPEQNTSLLKEIFYVVTKLETLYRFDGSFDLAIDAVLDIASIINQLSQRIAELKSNIHVPSDYLMELEKRFNEVKNSVDLTTKFSKCFYSFSDVGAHNIIRSKSMKINFIDLEFFGVDSFAKFCSDLYIHPKTLFSSKDLYHEIRNSSFFENNLAEEILLLLPMIALKWSVIAARRDFLEPNLPKQESNSRLFLDYFDYLCSQKSFLNVLTLQEFRKMR
jgi:hypothetical protein